MIATALDSSRRSLSAWVWEELADLEFSSFYDAFGGNARVAQFFKRQGYQTFVSDILQSHYWRAVALVQNNDAILTPAHFDQIMQHGNLSQYGDFAAWQDHYFTKEEAQLLGAWWQNIENGEAFQNSPELKGMAYTAVFMVMQYWLSINQTYLQPKNMSPEQVLKHYIQQLNSWVKDNQMPNMAYFTNAYDLASQLPADAVWINPPAMSGFRDTHRKAELSECWARHVTQINLSGVLPAGGEAQLGQTFQDSPSYLKALSRFLDCCSDSRIWILAHSERLGVSLSEMAEVVESKRSIWKRAVMTTPFPLAHDTLEEKDTLLIAVAK